MGIKKWIVKQGQKVANTTSRLSALSPAQIENINKERDAYYSKLADLNENIANTALTEALLASGSVEIFSAYLPQIKELYIPICQEQMSEQKDPQSSIRYFDITKWVNDKDEKSLEKLVNVYSVLSDENCNIALIFHRFTDSTKVFIAVTDNSENNGNNSTVKGYINRLHDAVNGNFPGSDISAPKSGSPFKAPNKSSVAAVTNIPTESSEKFISQTIEKLLDGIVPKNKSEEYTIILLATPVRDVEERKLRLAEIYSGFASYSSWQTSFTYTETNAQGSSANFGVNAGVSAGIQNGQNSSASTGGSETEHESNAKQIGTGDTETQNNQVTENETVNNAKAENKAKTDTTNTQTGKQRTEGSGEHNDKSSQVNNNAYNGGNINGGLPQGILSIGTNFGTSSGTSSGISSGRSTSVTDGTSVSFGSSKALTEGTTITEGIAKGVAKTVGSSVSHQVTKSLVNTLGRTVTKTVSNTVGLFNSVNLGGNFGASFARSSSVTATIGNNETITQTFTNYNIKHALELIEEQMKRFEQSSALGMWDFAAYIVSEKVDIANNVAHSYLALTEGEKSYMSRPAVNIWRGDMENKKSESAAAAEICKYLNVLQHPVFGIDHDILKEHCDYSVYPPVVTATTALSGKELAYSLNFPRKSIAGLPVIECAEFGRNIATYDSIGQEEEKLRLGSIFHMHHVEKMDVELSAKSLASHTFITGSTGAGKSNTVYKLIEEAVKLQKTFMVIEPAKGEYKHIFGMNENVSVYGTNPAVTPLLRLNPFSFPKGIHVLEHMDRLVEIFNVCWPMYAAMPAVLKNAIERAYEDCGWELTASKNRYGEELYPSFADVARNIKIIIDNSEYDTDNKGAYKGSLLTRLNSLTNGINGMIFNNDEIAAKELFDENVIVDLSRVGSLETKSLLMGILILKLQEYRMTGDEINVPLKHITVLEEAHHLLKRTSAEQSMETGNLTGKSVEMLANAIAEMRTYGEGFIIADQAPGLLDMSVIRNTNTKIIMRLPDKDDRELVGKAAGMNENQIDELAKLPCGVAAVYQNEWIQPVLCKVDLHDNTDERYSFEGQSDSIDESAKMEQRMKLASWLIEDWPPELTLEELNQARLPSFTKVELLRMQRTCDRRTQQDKCYSMCRLFPEIMKQMDRFCNRRTLDIEEIKAWIEQELSVYWTSYIDRVRRDNQQRLDDIELSNKFTRIIDCLFSAWQSEHSKEFADNKNIR